MIQIMAEEWFWLFMIMILQVNDYTEFWLHDMSLQM
jgi:hypothetical protein